MRLIFLPPPPLRKTKRCKRCSLAYLAKKPNCPHCFGINELELADLKHRYERQRRAASNLGKWFAFIAVIIFLALILINA